MVSAFEQSRIFHSCGPHGSEIYQTNFTPSWICREEVEVEPITPADDVPMELFASFRKLGAAKFGWLRMLKNSARNCTRACSVTLMFLKVEKSTVFSPGP